MRLVSSNLANCHATVPETTYTTSPDQTNGMKLEVQSEAMCHEQCALNHDATESAPTVSGVKQTDDGQIVYITCIPTTCCGEIF